MINSIKTLFSKELKDLNKAFDNIIKMKKIDGMEEMIGTLEIELKKFSTMKVTQKAGEGNETTWVNKNKDKNIYANIYKDYAADERRPFLELCWL